MFRDLIRLGFTYPQGSNGINASALSETVVSIILKSVMRAPAYELGRMIGSWVRIKGTGKPSAVCNPPVTLI
jgi:hypothetical protein